MSGSVGDRVLPNFHERYHHVTLWKLGKKVFYSFYKISTWNFFYSLTELW